MVGEGPAGRTRRWPRPVSWTPLARVLETVPLGAHDWLVVVSLTVVPAAGGQILDAVQTRGGGPSPPERDR